MNDKSFTFDNLIQLGSAGDVADAGVCGPDGCIVAPDTDTDTDTDSDADTPVRRR